MRKFGLMILVAAFAFTIAGCCGCGFDPCNPCDDPCGAPAEAPADDAGGSCGGGSCGGGK